MPPFQLELPASTAVSELQEKVLAKHSSGAEGPERVRLFAPAGDDFAGPVPPLVFCSRPAQTLEDLGLAHSGAAAATVYWASNLMKFQDDYAQIVPKCDERVAKAIARDEAAVKSRAAQERVDARNAFWALQGTAWPFKPAGAARTYYTSHANSYGEGELGDSHSLQLLPAEGEFRLHLHRWSDTGRKSRHFHTMTKGPFRLSAEAAGGGYELHMMPAFRFESAHIPPRWDDLSAFTPVARDKADPLPTAHIDADGSAVHHQGETLKLSETARRV